MENEPRRIEIFAPFGAAMEWTKLILFRPFDITKWLVIGFAAFLSNLGSGGNFSYRQDFGKGDWNFRTVTHGAADSVNAIPPWLIPILIIAAILIVIIVVCLMWVGARGRFIFIDCVVRNRAAIVAPWREFKREGNIFF